MNTETSIPCSCIDCLGSACTCGCQAASTTESAGCQCGCQQGGTCLCAKD